MLFRSLMYAMRSAIKRERSLSGELESSRDRLEKLFRSSQNPITVSRLEDGRYIEVNDAYLELFDVARNQVIGHTALELGVWGDPGDRDRFVQLMRERGVTRDFVTRMLKRSGEVIEAQLAAEVIELDGERCLLVSLADVTGRHEAERRAEQLATRDALTGLPNRDRKSTRLNSSHIQKSRMPSSA